MNYKNITIYFILGTGLLVGGFDVVIMFLGGKEASISQIMIDYAYEYPLFPFATGVVMGHLFWRMGDRKK